MKCRGRSVSAEGPKRFALNMKTSLAIRSRIEAAANESGLSLAQEVERRLIPSFDYQDAADYLRIALQLEPVSGRDAGCQK